MKCFKKENGKQLFKHLMRNLEMYNRELLKLIKRKNSEPNPKQSVAKGDYPAEDSSLENESTSIYQEVKFV